MTTKTEPVVCLMLKAPRPGLVKTRIARETGDAEAVLIYRRLVEFQMARLPRDWRIEIQYAPADAGTEMRLWLGTESLYEPQAGGDLGDRMRAAMDAAFVRGAGRLIFLGGDCPYVDAEILGAAAASLDGADVVLGPATDGGYYLIGMTQPLPGLFQNIDWGSGMVRRQTLRNAAGGGLRVAELREFEDVDSLSAWRRACRLTGVATAEPG
ncbi:MAG TPA: TIGR04282 family arsenosugar biosynthesis glycosyltransferase [Verrucomicrobiae bacterium]|nr:TIGR04282 family arsenosugar biosynthesis glycosyltransferase [Verrucomicrobiae bacterium]